MHDNDETNRVVTTWPYAVGLPHTAATYSMCDTTNGAVRRSAPLDSEAPYILYEGSSSGPHARPAFDESVKRRARRTPHPWSRYGGTCSTVRAAPTGGHFLCVAFLCPDCYILIPPCFSLFRRCFFLMIRQVSAVCNMCMIPGLQ